MTCLVVSAQARRDRDTILSYLVREAGRSVAGKFAQRFRNALALLTEQPHCGPARRELGSGSRAVSVPPYLLIYDYKQGRDEIVLLRILHGKRNMTGAMLRL